MNRVARTLLVLAAAFSLPLTAQAGWLIEWRHLSTKSNGEPLSSETATMRIAKGRVRLVQPHTISLIDYNTKRFAVLNVDRQLFWSGPLDDYIAEMVKNRTQAMRSRFGDKLPKDFAKLRTDRTTLPVIAVQKTDETATIAGYETQQYVVRSNGEPFQEMWIAGGLDLSADLDPEKFLDYQRKMSAAMIGSSAASYNALHRSKAYRQVLKKGFALKIITRHPSGGFERTVTAIHPAQVSADEFEVPEKYRRVRLADVFESGDTPPSAAR